MAGQEGSQGPKVLRAETSAEALVLLEEDEIGWDAADLHSVKQKAEAVPGMPLPPALMDSQHSQKTISSSCLSNLILLCERACCVLFKLAVS